MKRLLLRLPFLVGALRLALWALPFRQLLRLVHRWAEAPVSVSRRRAALPPETVAWAVRVVGRRMVPERPCLTLALAGLLLLRRRGHAARLRIGVKADDDGQLRAHAWIERAGRVLIGQLHDLDSFTLLPSVSDEVASRLAQRR